MPNAGAISKSPVDISMPLGMTSPASEYLYVLPRSLEIVRRTMPALHLRGQCTEPLLPSTHADSLEHTFSLPNRSLSAQWRRTGCII
jgi:hypothetical protein